MRFSQTLKFQIALSLLALVLLFSFFSVHTLQILQEQREQAVLLRLAGELQATAEHMAWQAMNYAHAKPPNAAGYERDLKLYFKDLTDSSERFDALCMAFSNGDFQGYLAMHEPMGPMLGKRTRQAAKALEQFWNGFLQQLKNILGDQNMPQLTQAANFILKQKPELTKRIDHLLQALDEDLKQRTTRTALVVRISFTVALLIAAGILLWFYLRVLRPLDATVEGFHKVANGNFAYRLPIHGNNELALLAATFNQTVERLDTLFQLTTRLQEGSDLDETLAFVSHALPRLLPLDWVGALFVSDDGMIQLEGAYSDGQPERLGLLRFPLDNTLLKQCLESGRPLHIPDVQEVAILNSSYRFLKVLAERQRRDAIFLPVTTQGALPGVLVFATRQANAYRRDHLELLANLTTVITLSFGRTLKLAEHARLAAIGQFVTGIAHEIRTPLATVGMALDYFGEHLQTSGEKKRLELAQHEMERIKRLLEEVLLYARPLKLKLEKVALRPLLRDARDSLLPEAEEKSVKIQLEQKEEIELTADPDRLLQILLNLLKNAIQAAPGGSTVTLAVDLDNQKTPRIQVCNPGEPIPPEQLKRVFEPFYTTRAEGTGLGLAIVRRLAQAHGGGIEVVSNDQQGTCFTLRLPRVPDY